MDSTPRTVSHAPEPQALPAPSHFAFILHTVPVILWPMPSSVEPGSAPPRWTLFRRTLTQYDRSKVSVARGLRNALGVALPLMIGAMFGQVEPALIMATGALNVGFADSTEAYLPRGRRMLAASLLVSLAVFLGSLCGWTWLTALSVAALWSFGAGMLVIFGPQTGNMGMTSTCVLLIYASHPLLLQDAALAGLLALGGGLLQTLISVIPWAGSTYEPERIALASLYSSLARLNGAIPSEASAPPASGKANEASAVIAARQGDHSLATERYRSLLDQGERIRACLLTLHSLRARYQTREPSALTAGQPSPVAVLVDRYLAAATRALDTDGEMLRSGRPAGDGSPDVDEAERILETFRDLPAGSEPGPLIADIKAQMDALTRQLRITFGLASHATPSGIVAYARSEEVIPWRLRAGSALTNLRANLSFRSTAFRHAVRLSVCICAADALGRFVGWQRPYWLPLTVAVVLKPDFSSTYSRGVLRLGGTFAGLVMATALFHFLPRSLPVEIALIMAITFILRWTGPAHYGVLAVSVSQLVVLLVALTGIDPSQVIMARARNTALGGIMALLAYWLWPTWERSQVAQIFAQMLDAYRAHFDLITRAFSADCPDLTEELDRTRSASRLSRTNLEASVDRLAAEPATPAAERDRWNAMLASSHIFAYSIIMLHATLLASPDSLRPLVRNAAFQDFVQKIGQTLELLASLLRGAGQESIAFPDLRAVHHRLFHGGEPMAARHSLISVEADKIVNSLNTLREQVLAGAAHP